MAYDPHQPRYGQPYGEQPPPPVSGPPQPPVPAQAYPSSPVPYGYLPPQPVVLQPAVPTSNLAVWSLVTGLVGFFAGWCLLGLPCLAAVALGHGALSDTKDNVKSGRGMAVAGLALGYVALLPAIILFFWLVLGGAAGAFLPGAAVTSAP
jgi:hypothetical protein